MSAPVPVRVGILGLGSIGRVHATALRTLDQQAQVVAASGGTPGQLERCGWPDASHVPPDRLMDPDLCDIIAIATPSGAHADNAQTALSRGLDVVVEKPLATTTEDATTVLEHAARHGRTVYPVAQRRLEPVHRAVGTLLASGDLGDLVLAEAAVHWHRDEAYYDAAPWRRQMPGGGALMNQALHSIDLLCWLLGPVATVSAETAIRGHARCAEDTSVVALVARSGALGAASCSTSTPPGLPARLSLRTTRGAIDIEQTSITRWDVTDVPQPRIQEPTAYAGSSDPTAIGHTGHVAAWTDILAARHSGRPATVTARDAWHTVATIDAAYRSATTGRREHVGEPPS